LAAAVTVFSTPSVHPWTSASRRMFSDLPVQTSSLKVVRNRSVQRSLRSLGLFYDGANHARQILFIFVQGKVSLGEFIH